MSDIVTESITQMESGHGLVWSREWIEDLCVALRGIISERDRLRADLAHRTAERDQYDELCAELRRDCIALRSERDRLAAEVADLKAQSDPLAEMWRELSSYQPIADRDGHGESWRRMCRERTEASSVVASEIGRAHV